MPIDARIARASDAPIEAVKLSDFTHALAGAPGLARIIVVDGARNANAEVPLYTTQMQTVLPVL